jgi:CubicO group peptidase (beta-lactamase class C family)
LQALVLFAAMVAAMGVALYQLVPPAVVPAAVQPLPTGLAENLSKGYHHRDGAYDAKDFGWVSNAPSAPVHTTATDMGRFMLAHLNGGEYSGRRILNGGTAAEMHRRQFTRAPSLPGTTYGFINSRANGRRVLLHDGERALLHARRAPARRRDGPGALNLGLLVWFVLSLLGFAETYVWPAEAVAMITRLWLLGVPLTLVVVLSVLAWKKGYWGAA